MNIWKPADWPAIEAIGTWVAAIGTIGAVLVALGLARRDTKSRRIERRGEIVAMCADVYHARKRMETLTEQNIQAPLYRIPDSTLSSGLPNLIGEGRLRKNEVAVLLEYANKIAEINRGLDRAGAAHAAQPGGSDLLSSEFARNQAKANEVIEPADDGQEPLINQAERALYRMDMLYSPWWIRLAVAWKGWVQSPGKAPK
jgi:hypothetical protein